MRRALASLLAAGALLVSGCAGPTAAPAATGPAPVPVVTSTDVYADIVKAVGGDAVAVRAIIDSPAKDPHEYEADAQSELAISKARLVVENGGGYDDFVETMLAPLAHRPTVVDVAEVSGYDQQPASGEFNEHLWYDVPTMIRLTERLRAELTALAPAGAATFTANAEDFRSRLEGLERGQAAIAEAHTGTGVAVTEPVPLYLLQASGLVDRTPPEFSEAVEEGRDVPPALLRQTTDLFDSHEVALLAYNEQAGGPQTDLVVAAARRDGVAVLPVTETLPPGQTYLSWMQGYLTTIATTLEG